MSRNKSQKYGRARQSNAPQRRPGEPDDIFNFPSGYMARWGRLTEISWDRTPEQHEEYVEAFLEEANSIHAKQGARRARLHEIFDETDSADLVARASLTYLQIDPNSFKEWESDKSPAHIEYLALQALGRGLPSAENVDPMRASALTWEAIEIVREMFRAASKLIVIDAIAELRTHPEAATHIEYAMKTRLESLAVRGTGYAEHLIRVLHGCMDPFESECRELLGFTASDALTVTHALADLISDRLETRTSHAIEEQRDMLRSLKRARRRRHCSDPQFPAWLLDLPPTEAKMRVSMLVTTWLFADGRSLAEVTPEELSESCRLDPPVCRSAMDAFTCDPSMFVEDHHAFPYGSHPLLTKPALRTKTGYVVPVPSAMIDAIRPRMEDLLASTKLWDRYADARGKWVEREATRILASALPGSVSWVGLPWTSCADNSDLDGLVSVDDVAVRLQCKAGRLTAAARRGAPGKMKRDIGNLIESAAKQHRALATALDQEGAEAIGFSDLQASALTAPLQFEAIICLDDVTVWATEAHKLRRLGTIPHDRDVPWVLSLTDLMAVVDLLQGTQLVHYLVRRRRIERDGRVEAHDELDWVGHYIAEGLYFDDYFTCAKPPDVFKLLSYTERIDSWYFARAGDRTVVTPKPAQEIPPYLSLLIRRLESDRPRHWSVAALAFLDGDGESRQAWDVALAHAHKRVPEMGWSNASQVFAGRLGVTFYFDLRIPWPSIKDLVDAYCERKAEEENTHNWIAVGEGLSGGLFVITTNRNMNTGITEVFLEPTASAHQHGEKATESAPRG